jgi:hypothetical protein
LAEYTYEIFLSYRRKELVEQWIDTLFLDRFTYWLGEGLNGTDARIFVDRKDIAGGDAWRDSLGNALRGSRCLVPIWSPKYFRSEHCVAEWASFVRREEMVGACRLVIPIRWCDGQNFPQRAKEIQQVDFSEFSYTGEAFKKNEKFTLFEDQVREFAKDVAAKVMEAPQCADWPVVTPAEALLLSDLMPPASPITKPTL